jgi:hypothetical protein
MEIRETIRVLEDKAKEESNLTTRYDLGQKKAEKDRRRRRRRRRKRKTRRSRVFDRCQVLYIFLRRLEQHALSDSMVNWSHKRTGEDGWKGTWKMNKRETNAPNR